MLLKVKVAPGHRYAELPLRMADGTKLYIDKGPRYAVVNTADLAEGEEFAIRRWEMEGRLLVKAVEPKPEPAAENAENLSKPPTYRMEAETGILKETFAGEG